MASLYLGVHDVCGKLVSHCKELMSSVNRDQTTFFHWWNATSDLVSYLVQLVSNYPIDPRLANEKAEVLGQAQNIEQLVGWILNELQGLHEDPNSKTPAAVQQLSSSVRDQLKVALQALGNVTKKFTVIESQLRAEPESEPQLAYEDPPQNSAEGGYEQEIDQVILEVAREFLLVVTDHSFALFNSDNQTVVMCNKQLNALMVELLTKVPTAVEGLKATFMAFQQNCKKYIASGADQNAATFFVNSRKQLEETVAQLLPPDYRQVIEIEISGKIQQQTLQASLFNSNNPYANNNTTQPTVPIIQSFAIPQQATSDKKPPRPDSSVLDFTATNSPRRETSASPPIHFQENPIPEEKSNHEDAKTLSNEENSGPVEFNQDLLVQRILEIMAETCPRGWEELENDPARKAELQRDIQGHLINYVKTKKRAANTNALRESKPTVSSAYVQTVQTKKKKGDNRLKRPLFVITELGAPGAPTQGTPIGNATIQVALALFDFGTEFTDNEISWDQNWKAPFKPAHYTNHSSRKILESNISSIISELKTLTEALSISNPSEAFSTIKQKIVAMLVYRKAVVLPHDAKQFAKAQHLRWAKRELLNNINVKVSSIQALCTQFLTTYQTAASSPLRADDIETYHLLGLISQFHQLLMDAQDDVETYLEFGKIECNYKRGPFSKIKPAKGASDGVWKDKQSYESARTSMDPFEPCTLNTLAVKMTNSTLNKDVLSAFLAGYNFFSSAKVVWRKMEDRYYVPKDCPADIQGQEKFVQLRVARWILDWLKADLHAIEDNVIVTIKGFADQLKADTWYELSAWVLGELTSAGRFASHYLPIDRPTKITLFQTTMPTYNIFVTYDPIDLAQQMTLVDWDIYKRLSHFELENQNWSKDKTKYLARNVIDLITRTNHISYYVATMMVNTRKLKMRIRLLSRLIAVAKHCLEIGNMTSLMGILTGLSQSSVSRLKCTWAKLPTSQQADWKRFEALQDPSSAFKNWRDQMVLIKDPKLFKSVPYIGLVLSDLTFMDEGNPIMTEKGLVNFPKFQMITNAIKELLKYQKNQYDFPPVEPLCTILKKLPSLMIQEVFMEKELFALSLEREPRNCDPKTLE